MEHGVLIHFQHKYPQTQSWLTFTNYQWIQYKVHNFFFLKKTFWYNRIYESMFAFTKPLEKIPWIMKNVIFLYWSAKKKPNQKPPHQCYPKTLASFSLYMLPCAVSPWYNPRNNMNKFLVCYFWHCLPPRRAGDYTMGYWSKLAGRPQETSETIWFEWYLLAMLGREFHQLRNPACFCSCAQAFQKVVFVCHCQLIQQGETEHCDDCCANGDSDVQRTGLLPDLLAAYILEFYLFSC